jgi:hypothetical protein
MCVRSSSLDPYCTNLNAYFNVKATDIWTVGITLCVCLSSFDPYCTNLNALRLFWILAKIQELLFYIDMIDF